MLPRVTRRLLWLGREGRAPNPPDPDVEVVEFASGGLLLPSEFDKQLQKVDASGIIQGGLAPRLVRVAKGDQPPAKLHASLDPSRAPTEIYIREAENLGRDFGDPFPPATPGDDLREFRLRFGVSVSKDPKNTEKFATPTGIEPVLPT